ncbi:copper chaperone PCu(A)C [uncultured Bartonella sp.]|uniref:copper chaperone PCu(A)C n=1 Tax=uncultured Bartonella sp. TaxID=104108 RepID=UPI002611F6C8|nr:copper chaperone PCu(A)C [uncultured Bartonella sp.]
MGIVSKNSLIPAFFALVLFSLSALAEDFTKGSITVESPWVKKSQSVKNGAEGFASIHNGGVVEDHLISISADISNHTSIHEIIEKNGGVKMRKTQTPLAIEPNGYLELKPGGYHFMFFNCQDELRDDEMIPAILHFEKNGDVKVNFLIKTADDELDNP